MCRKTKIRHIQSQNLEIRVSRPKLSEKSRYEADIFFMPAWYQQGPVQGEGHQHVVGGGQGEGLHELDDTDGTHQAFKLGSSKLELSWNYLGTN